MRPNNEYGISLTGDLGPIMSTGFLLSVRFGPIPSPVFFIGPMLRSDNETTACKNKALLLNQFYTFLFCFGWDIRVVVNELNWIFFFFQTWMCMVWGVSKFDIKSQELTSPSLWGQFHQHVYVQLLRLQILKAQKRKSTQAAFCAFGICGVKAAHKHIDEIDPLCQERVVEMDQQPFNQLNFQVFVTHTEIVRQH